MTNKLTSLRTITSTILIASVFSLTPVFLKANAWWLRDKDDKPKQQETERKEIKQTTEKGSRDNDKSRFRRAVRYSSTKEVK